MIILAIFAILSFLGCSENSIMSAYDNNGIPMVKDSIMGSVEVIVKRGRYGGFVVTVKNNLNDTINDFYIQLSDSTTKI